MATWYWLEDSHAYGFAHRDDCRIGGRVVPVARQAGATEIPAAVAMRLPDDVVCRPCRAREDREGWRRVDAWLSTRHLTASELSDALEDVT